MSNIKTIWQPVSFREQWNQVDTAKFDIIFPSWRSRRNELQKDEVQYQKFIEQLKRRQAIDTGIIERMYDLKRGITETFIKEGFVETLLQHGDTNVPQNELMNYLKDNAEAIDFVFDFVKEQRSLSTSFIKELHALITRSQSYTEAIDQFGQTSKIPLLKGEYKVHNNNPLRDGVVYSYCPPEQVASEMDNLLHIINSKMENAHVLVKAAFLHHSFVQIHPFQDGNGRMARLLASFVLIKEGLFPLVIDRDHRTKYIDALEAADGNNYQPLVNVFLESQVSSIGKALNWKTIESTDNYDRIYEAVNEKIGAYKKETAEKQYRLICENMVTIHQSMLEITAKILDRIKSKIPECSFSLADCAPTKEKSTYYYNQIIEYAKTHEYYINTSLNKSWIRVVFSIDSKKLYRLVISLHHFGYDKNTFAIGAFLSKPLPITKKEKYVDVPLGLPPLTFSSKEKSESLSISIENHLNDIIIASLAFIANEL